MAIRTYEDITTIERRTITDLAQVDEVIRATDLRNEVRDERSRPDGEAVEYLRWGAYNEEGGEVVFFAGTQRAGIALGADAQWTDADSADDGLERFFGVDDKEMMP